MNNSNTVTIVMVEDNDGHATLIEMNLREAGLSNPIIRLSDGQIAVDFFKERADQLSAGGMLVLLDLNLPIVDGYGVLQALKSHQNTCYFPIIVLTSTDDEREINRCYELGCNVYLRKPVNYEDFMRAIRRLGLFISVIQIPGKQILEPSQAAELTP